MHPRATPRPSRIALVLWCLSLGLGPWLPACGDDDGGTDLPLLITRDQALQACVAADACGIVTFAFSGSYCLEAGWDQRYVTSTIPIWNSIFRCVLEVAPDCAQVEACFGQGDPLEACTAITDGHCDGDVRVECDTAHRKLIRQDCSLANQHCTMAYASMTDQVPKCGWAACVEGQDPAECLGNLLLSCAGGVYEITDCSAQGMVCGDGVTGSKACVGTGVSCMPDTSPPYCDGHVLHSCVHRRLHFFDCSTMPGDYTCSPASFSCVTAGTDCVPGDREACQGSTVRLCVDGTWQALDCATLGFSGCMVSPAGGAHCVP